jgi:hypothetical protein
MISRGARAVSVVIPGAGRVSKHPKVVVEGMILLHHDNDVIDVAEISIGKSRVRRQKNQNQRREYRRRKHPS